MCSEKAVTTSSPGLYDITDTVGDIVAKSGIAEGVCVVFSKSATAGVVVTADAKAHEDILDDLERIFPPRTNYTASVEPKMAAANSAAAISGRPMDFIIHDSEIVLGKSQGIFVLDTVGGRIIDYGVKCI